LPKHWLQRAAKILRPGWSDGLRAAQCIANPYFARAQAPAGPRYQRQHGGY
jgi:hypothetical protein